MSQKLVMKLVYRKGSWSDPELLMLVIAMDYQLVIQMELMLVFEYLPMVTWWVNLMDYSLDYPLEILLVI